MGPHYNWVLIQAISTSGKKNHRLTHFVSLTLEESDSDSGCQPVNSKAVEKPQTFFFPYCLNKANMQTFQSCFTQPRKNRKVTIPCKVTTFQSMAGENNLCYRCIHGKNST